MSKHPSIVSFERSAKNSMSKASPTNYSYFKNSPSDIDKFFNNNDTVSEFSAKEFKYESLGGDASLLYLTNMIDRGIIRKTEQDLGLRGHKWKKWVTFFKPLRHLAMIVYLANTIIERPAWCIELDKKIRQ